VQNPRRTEEEKLTLFPFYFIDLTQRNSLKSEKTIELLYSVKDLYDFNETIYLIDASRDL
jgi:hypothetical protein